MKSITKIAIVCAVAMCLAAVLWMAAGSRGALPNLTYSQFLQQVRTGQVASVVVFGGNAGAIQATGRLKDGKIVHTVLPSDYRDALVAMQDKLVNVEIRDSSAAPLRQLMNAAPFLVLLGVWILLLMFRQFPNRLWRGVLS